MKTNGPAGASRAKEGSSGPVRGPRLAGATVDTGFVSARPKARAATRTPPELLGLLAAGFVLFAAVGAWIVDDYGVNLDEVMKRNLAEQTVAYVLAGDRALFSNWIRSDGVVFELGQWVVARLLGLEDSRDVYLSYHMTSHLFFLFSGAICAVLSYRMTGSRATAVVAFLLFVLHPRLYAHSFFNAKDIPFLGLFMISLWSIHRAFRRDTLGAFALCGACVALAFNVRVMAFVLVLGALAMRGLDLCFAGSREARRHVLATVGVFLAVMVATIYATWPRLWAEPLSGMFEAIRWVLKTFRVLVVFDGEALSTGDVPRRYIPTWLGLTTPPFTLLLGLAGTAVALRRLAKRPREALRNTPVRFECLCLMASWGAVAALVVGGANLYNGWRPLYFLAAPFSVLAALGLAATLASFRRRAARLAVGGLAVAAAGSTAAAMADIHPYQNVYFNRLADRDTPERLRQQYDLDYWATSYREALEYMLRRHPSSKIHVHSFDDQALVSNRFALPSEDRRRIVVGTAGTADYYITNHREHSEGGIAPNTFAPVVYSRKVYNSTIMSVAATNLAMVDEEIAERYWHGYEDMAMQTPVAEDQARFFLDGLQLGFAQERCARSALTGHMDLRLWSRSMDDRSRRRDIRLRPPVGLHGVLLDGVCWVVVALPWRPARLDVRLMLPHHDIRLWRTEIRLEDRQEQRP